MFCRICTIIVRLQLKRVSVSTEEKLTAAAVEERNPLEKKNTENHLWVPVRSSSAAIPTWWQFFSVFSSLSLIWWPSMLILKYSSSSLACASADLVSLFNIWAAPEGERPLVNTSALHPGLHLQRHCSSTFCFSFSVQMCLLLSTKLNKASCSLVSPASFFFVCARGGKQRKWWK